MRRGTIHHREFLAAPCLLADASTLFAGGELPHFVVVVDENEAGVV